VRVSGPEKITLVEGKKSNWMAAGVHRETPHNQHQIFGEEAIERSILASVIRRHFPQDRLGSMIQELALGLGWPSQTGR
jgi:hypothetical protein